jgi:hypothetical protein
MGYGQWAMGYGLWAMGYGLWAMGYGLWAMGYRLSAIGYRLSIPLRLASGFSGIWGIIKCVIGLQRKIEARP